ncbi:MAG TPA: hypothetical protein VNA69_02815 [Thermoanaerobaculia bacterium]|nr:hypothetical protein [Thermoanaerobaculia bacterium]
MLQIELFIWIVLQLLHVAAPSPPPPNPVDFARDVRPILERRCQPCHFEGGKMYAKLPFDRAETIDRLGTKLFSRIKKDEEQALIRAFLARPR